MKLLKKYGTVASNSEVAVSYFTGTKADAAAKESDYYMIQVAAPEITAEQVFSSVFAVTDYSANYARAKELVFTLQTDEEIRTLLQYGIKGEDYEINDGVLEMIKDNDDEYAYKMNPLYTGNGYITYAGEGIPMSYWEDVKAVNYVAKTNPYIGMETFFNKYADKADTLANVNALKALSDSVKAKITEMDAEEFEEFIAEWNNSATENALVKSIKDSAAYTKSLAKLGDLYNKYAEEYAAKGKVEASTATVTE
jgi:putative aldouronate transport system substrate-binding protein